MAVKGGQLHGKETQSPQRDTDGLQKGTVTFLRCQDNCTGDRRRTVKKRMTEGAAVFLPPIPGGGGGGDKNVPSTVLRRFSQKRPPTVTGGPEGSPVQLALRLNRSILPRRTPIPRRERERSHPSSNAANRGGKPGQLAIRRVPGLRRSCVNAA